MKITKNYWHILCKVHVDNDHYFDNLVLAFRKACVRFNQGAAG
jgi:hypothetical protein